VTNIREISDAYQAGIAVGRAAAKHEMDELAKIIEATAAHASIPVTVTAPGNGSRKRPGPVGKATKHPQAPKKTVIARGAKKAHAPRIKGVKQEILRMIGESQGGVTVDRIIASTGFKETSVRATLMSLKKSGLASQDSEKRWVLSGQVARGNSGDEAHADL
jgi:hypothetical protein